MRVCIYHSREWEILADSGWITHCIETVDNGIRLAFMVHKYWNGE